MTEVPRVYGETSGETLLAYTDTHLCYCPECARKLGYDEKGKWGPNRLPFIEINTPDELPQKQCDSCDRHMKPES